jgi:hypothetical protein
MKTKKDQSVVGRTERGVPAAVWPTSVEESVDFS